MAEQIENENMVLLSASYDGIEKKACLKFYDEKTDSIKLWYDSSGHKPYCLVKKDTDQDLLDKFKNEDKIINNILKKHFKSQRLTIFLFSIYY